MALVPKRLQVKIKVTELLEGINPTNDDPATEAAYAPDMRNKVFRGRSEIGKETGRPFLAILEAPKNEPGRYGSEEDILAHGEWQILIQGFVDNAKPHETDGADLLLAQVEQRLSRITEVISEDGINRGKGKHAEYRLGGLLSGARIGQGVVRPADKQVSDTAYFYLVLTVKLETNPANPYVET